MKTFLLMAILGFSVSSFAHDLKYDTYLSLQKSLAQDDFKSAKKTWITICEKEIGHYAKDYSFKECDKNIENIKDLRNSFKSLSEIYIKNGETIKNGEIVTAKCSMANARWLQKKGEIQNPYYGAKMLTCGEVDSGN